MASHTAISVRVLVAIQNVLAYAKDRSIKFRLHFYQIGTSILGTMAVCP